MNKKIRRVVTGHSEDGTANFVSDEKFATVEIPSGDAAFSLIWTTSSVPADLNDTTDGRFRDAGLTINGGSVIRVVDMLPGASSPFHRSSSIDYGVVMSGCIELELDNGIFKTCSKGDIIVQQGTIHLWRNPSDTDICRMVFILVEAKPFEVNGNPLEDVMGR
ncbi:MAG: cupin domain-containing protein [Lewinella sp.]